MKQFRWNEEKNEQLKLKRGISFEKMVQAIENGQALQVLPHPNAKKYPRQSMYVIHLNDYAYLVPFVEEEDSVFLKTIIPSRKATKKYLGDQHEKI